MSKVTEAPAATTRLRLPGLTDGQQMVLSLCLIVLGCALRIVWTMRGHLPPVNSEAFFLAQALAEGRGFSEAFGLGTGPTAHLMPTTPLVPALIYAVLGVGTPSAEGVLIGWALLQFSLAAFLAERVAQELGVNAWARLGALAVVCIFPVQYHVETQLFRVWEAGVATCVFLGVFVWVLRLDRQENVGWRASLGLGVANGLTFVISPGAAIATSGLIGLLFLRRLRVSQWVPPIFAAIAIVAGVLIPWGIRNEVALGKFIPLRTGAGISLALGYNSTRLNAPDRQADDFMRFKEVSPLMSEAAKQHYIEVGEVAYNTELRKKAQAWIAANPGEAWRIRGRNVLEFYVPPKWFWTRFTDGDVPLLTARQLVIATSAVLGGLTLAVGLILRRRRWLYLLPAILLPSLPYVFTFPQLRYRYLISTLLIILAAEGVVWLLTWLGCRGARRSS